MNFPTLYGKTKTNKIKVWDIWVVSKSDGTARIEMRHGLLNGKMTDSFKDIARGKNIGKSNETTPYEQACSEAQSRWNKQLDKGYAVSEDDIQSGSSRENFLPMLAVRYDKRGTKIKWPALVQPKLDGYRSLAKKEGSTVTLWSRRGKIFDVPKEIIKELEQILKDGESLDGEIYKHEWRGHNGEPNFQRISSAIKKYNQDTPMLEYHIYDIPNDKLGFKERFVDSDIISRIRSSGSSRVKVVETVLVISENEAYDLYHDWISSSLPYEGAMVRNISGKYLYDHRSNDLQKLKPQDDEEFEIVGGEEGTGHDSGTVIFTCKNSSGDRFNVRPTGTREQRSEYWDNLDNYIGQWLTVEFNGWTNDGKPRFPRGVRIRPSWDLDKSKPSNQNKNFSYFNPFDITDLK